MGQRGNQREHFKRPETNEGINTKFQNLQETIKAMERAMSISVLVLRNWKTSSKSVNLSVEENRQTKAKHSQDYQEKTNNQNKVRK